MSPIGFVILAGLALAPGVTVLRSIIIARPGLGHLRRLLRAVKLVFDVRGDRKIWLDVVATNHRAFHLYRDIGFIDEGLLRAHHRSPDGMINDLHFLGMLREDYLRRCSAPG